MTIRAAVRQLTPEQRRDLATHADKQATTEPGAVAAVWREMYGLLMEDEATDEALDLALQMTLAPIAAPADWLTTEDIVTDVLAEAARIFPPRVAAESNIYGAAGTIRDLADRCMAMPEDQLATTDLILARCLLALQDAGLLPNEEPQ